MTRDELEAVIRRQIDLVAAAAIRPVAGAGMTATLNVATDAILAAHDQCALDTYGIPADRRDALTAGYDPHDRRPAAANLRKVAELQSEAARRAGLRTYPAAAIRRQEQADIPRRGRKNPP